MREANPTLSKDVVWHLTKHGIRENQDGSYSWKYDYYTRSPDFSLKHEDTIEIWKQISCPVLVVNADMGLSHRVGHNDTLRYFQAARLEVLEKATHWIFHDQKLATMSKRHCLPVLPHIFFYNFRQPKMGPKHIRLLFLILFQ